MSKTANIISSFHGGMSRDDVLLQEGEYIYSDGFDITRYPGELRPMPTIVGVSTIGTLSSIGTCTFLKRFNDTFVGTSEGKIYDNNGNLLYNSGYSQSIIDVIFFGNTANSAYVFLDNRVLKGTLSGTTFSGFSSVYSGTAVTRPVMAFGEMYFGAGTQVKRVDVYGNLENVYQVDKPTNTSVTFLSTQGSYLRVYYQNYESGATGGGLDIIDIGSLTVSYNVKLPFQPTGGVSANISDYIQTSADIYECSGLEYRSICETYYSEIMAGNKFQFSLNDGMDYANERLYITSYDKYLIYGSKHDGLKNVFCYGAYDWLNQDHDQILKLYANKANDEVWFAFSDDGDLKVGYIDHGNYSSSNAVMTATLITPYHNLGDYSITKQLEEIRVGMKNTADGTLYASFDGGAYELVGYLNQSTLGQKIMDFKKDFREVSFKIVLSGIIHGRKVTNINLRYTPYGV